MPHAPYQPYYDHLIDNVLTPFYQKRLIKLQKLTLGGILKRKNPYLFKAKNFEIAAELVKAIVDAHLSSQEETIFGNLLEDFAIFVSTQRDKGFKSNFKSIDLEFRRKRKYYIVGIKSGIHWGNSDQINRMKDNFKIARQKLREQGIGQEIVAVNGCMYGSDRSPYKPDRNDPERSYWKYAGQDFWLLISEDDNFYQELIVPIDQEAKQKDETFKKAYASQINQMTEEFIGRFVTNNQIDWVKLLDSVSKRRS